MSEQFLKFSADKIFTSTGSVLERHVIITDTLGKILAIDELQNHDQTSVRKLNGYLCPGFVNSHCHLELSHMKGLADSGTGLLPFLNKVVSYRDIDQDVIDQAIKDGDEEMYNNGIVAVGDISNKTDTCITKSKSKIDYFTFVEMFDFMQASLTGRTIDQYKKVMQGQSNHDMNRKSYVPHAPYTVSPSLFSFINENNISGTTISIHNQETPNEDALFQRKEGDFLRFFEGFGFKMDFFKAIGKNSIYYTLQHLKPIFKTIFVHNTLSNSQDIKSASDWNKDIYWATCPNANLYIENRLPDYNCFLETGAVVTIGTDSLTSNWQLSIWEEVKTINKFASFISLETLITWGTINGAQALSYDDRLGSIEVGKTPGLVHLKPTMIKKNYIVQELNPVRLI